MRAILILCAVTLVLGVALIWRAARLPRQFGAFTGTPKAEVADLMNQPNEFLHKTVTIEGTVRQQCTTMGCYFFFLSGEDMLRVELKDIAMNAPRRNGHLARVEGQIVPFDGGYQFLASAVEFE
jgi:hypothetical protein